MSNKTQKLYTSRANNLDANTYIGEAGRIFYDEPATTNTAPTLRYSDGVTPGGIPITTGGSSGGGYALPEIIDGGYLHEDSSGHLTWDSNISLYTDANVTTLLNTTGISGNIIPSEDNAYTLGNPTNRWKSIHIGPGTLYITDRTLGTNAELTVDNGVLQINGANQLQVGQLKFVDNTIESTTGNVDIQIGLVDSTADVKINRNTVLAAGKTFGLVDTVTGNIARMSVTSGVLNIDGANQLQVGQLKFVDNTIESTTGTTDIQIGLTTSTANIVLNRDTVLSNNKTISWGLNTGDYETEKYFVIGLDENGGIESAIPSAYLETMGNIALNIDVNGNQWFFGNDGSFTLPGGIKTADTTTDIILGTDDGSDTGSITAYRTYQLRDGNDNVLMQIQNEDGVGKLKFDGGSDGIWYDGGVVIKGVGHSDDYYGIQPMSYNSASGQVTYGQLNYAHFQGFPRLPNFSSDTAANTAIAAQTQGGDFYNTPQRGQMYYNTTTDKAMVYTASGWQAMN